MTVDPATAPSSLESPAARYRRRAIAIVTSDQLMIVYVLAACVGIWELVAVGLDIKSYVLPRPGSVAGEAHDHWRLVLDHTEATAIETGLGFALAAVGGVGLGAAMFYVPILDKVLSPLVVILQTIPKVALAPLFVVWIGTSILPRVLVAAVIAFFPVLIDTIVGLRSTKKISVELVRSMGASKLQTFQKVEFPSSLPNIFGALRVATTLAVIGAVVGEYIAANKGLGYLQLQASATLNSALLFVAVIAMSLLGLIAYKLVEYAERLVIPWHRAHR